MTKTEGNAILLNWDDLPVCPKHGIRLQTDYFPAQGDEPEHELGRCNLCRKLYRFEFRENE